MHDENTQPARYRWHRREYARSRQSD